MWPVSGREAWGGVRTPRHDLTSLGLPQSFTGPLVRPASGWSRRASAPCSQQRGAVCCWPWTALTRSAR